MLDVTRARLSVTGEWLTAVACLAATVVVGLLLVQELRVASEVTRRPAPVSTQPVVATGDDDAVPSEAVSLPALTLGPNEIHVGDRSVDAARRVGAAAVLVKTTTQNGPLGPREIRAYELAGTRVILVFEPFERRGEPRVAAIYLQ